MSWCWCLAFRPEAAGVREMDGLAERLLELAEENPLFREQFQDLLHGSMTDLAPNSDGFACVSSVKDFIDSVAEKRKPKPMSDEEKVLHQQMVRKSLGVAD